MSVPLRELLLLLPIAAAVALCAPAHAQRQQDRGERAAEARGGQQHGRVRGQERPQRQGPANRQERRQDSMADSIRHVRRSSRGQILSAERMHSDGREINRIKVVDDHGRVRVFEDDPQRRRNQRSRGDDD